MNVLLGNRIRSLRSAGHYTREQIADWIGISRQRYARIENGTNNITLEVLSQIADVLDVKIGDITKVLEETETPVVAYRTGPENASSEKIFAMLDLFYANKHLYRRSQQDMDV